MGDGECDLFMEIVRSNGSLLQGESMDADFKGQIEVSSFNFGGPSFDSFGGNRGKRKKLTTGDIQRLQQKAKDEEPAGNS